MLISDGKHIFFALVWFVLKSVNLQHNMLVWWADGTNKLSNKCLMFQVLFEKTLSIYFLISYKITKIKSFECPKSIRNYEKKNTWNVRRFVDELFVPSAQQTSILCCRLSDSKFDLKYLKSFQPFPASQ